MVSKILNAIYECGIVSIVRGIQESHIRATVEALYEGGIRGIEITLDTPGALRMIEKVKAEFGQRMTVGAGTALDGETARAAILAGADFVLSPTLSTAMIEMCNRYSKLAVPGVLTPTEILMAWQAGAQLVKVFPARVFGPAYIKDVKGPLPQVEIMPVGGVSLDNAEAFIRNGAFALGIGTQLVDQKTVQSGDFQEITERARKFIEKVEAGRNIQRA